MHYVYILRSKATDKSYVGYTSGEVEKRLDQHNVGSNKWTKGNKPFKLVYYETYICKEDAIRREKFFKSGLGKQIKKLILDHFGVEFIGKQSLPMNY